jgi:hypothetical protein
LSEEQLDFVKVGFVFSAALALLCWSVAPYTLRLETFAALGVYPLGLGLLFWPAAGYLLTAARSDFGRSACLGAVAFYNYWVAEQLTASGDGSPALIERLWGSNRLGLAVVAALYVGGQLALVLPQVWERRRRPVRLPEEVNG